MRKPAIQPRFLGMHIVAWLVILLITVMPLVLASPTARGVGRLPGNTNIAGVNVSSLRPEDAIAILTPTAREASTLRFTITVMDIDHIFTAAEIGLVFDAATTVQMIMADGQGGDYPLHVQMQPHQFQDHLGTIADSLPSPARNADLRIQGTTATVIPAASGQTMDVDAYRAEILAAVGTESPQLTITLAHGEPEITTAEADATATEVNAILQQPLVLSAGAQNWEIGAELVASAMVIGPDGSGDLAIQWNLDVLQPNIDAIVRDIESSDRNDAWVQDLGTHSWLVPEQGQMVVDRKKLIEIVSATLAIGERTVKVPVAVVPAEKSTEDVMAELGITQLIATGDSVYEGSGAGRAHNVETAAYYIDRTLVAPGGSYSFNDSVGSLFSGEYMSAGSYIDGPGGQSIAGGVCQVSTTVFRAALNAGFPIEERWPHSYRTVFYEMGGWGPGFDAAIVQDSGAPQESTDLRFTNPTGSWLLITASTDGDKLVVEIWGEETQFRVQYSEPEVWVTHYAPENVTVMVDDQLPAGTLSRQEKMDGLSVVIVRSVFDRDGKLVLSDTWETTYYATGPVVRASPDMEQQAYLQGG